MNKKVSVIIPAFNSERFVLRCIESVRNQTYKNIEIILIEDGSIDNTKKIIKTCDNIKILYNDSNMGAGFSRTKGLNEATGYYVSFLDADDFWDCEFLKNTVKFLEDNTEAIAVSTGYMGIDLKGNNGIFKPMLDDKDKEFYISEGRICPDFFDFWTKYFGVLTGTVLIRTDSAIKAGGQRAELRLTQDLEFWGYLSTFGKWGFIPKPLFITDPGILLPSERLYKLKRRYNFFSSLEIDEWTKRIDSRITKKNNSYYKVVNHIKNTIVISNVYSFNFSRSYNQVAIWNDDLESGLGGVLKKWHKFGKLLWPVISIVFRVREFIKSYISYYIRMIKK